MRKRSGTRTQLVLLTLAWQSACTGPNPAYHPAAPAVDASTDESAASVMPAADAAPTPDAAAPSPDLPPPAPDLSPAAPDVPGVEPTGLVSRWRLDESGGTEALDDRRANPGTLHNGVGRSTEVFPGARFANPGAASFDGVDDYVDLGVATLPSMQAAKSVSLWCRPRAMVTTGRRNLLVLNNRTQEESLQLGMDNGFPAVWEWGPGPASLIGDTRLEARWYHVAYVYDGAVQRLYVDGEQVATRVAPPPNAPVAGAHLGTYDPVDDRDELWSGLIDDVRIYDRGLVVDEIAWLAAGGD